MKISVALESHGIKAIVDNACRAEKYGYDVLSTSETDHNPFLPLVLAAEHTSQISLQTSIALAFARSPMDLAYIAWDLQSLSKGRFTLGLGSQVRGHIVRRFNMNWTAPGPRMRECIIGLRHIWRSWQNEEELNFKGDFYSFNLMPPVFNPGSIEHPEIKIAVAAVNPNMLRVAGEVADGVLLHSFNTPKYTREVVLPNIREGAAITGRSLEDVDIRGGGFIIVGRSEEDIQRKRDDTKKRIAFYASTRSYSSVMNLHGWNDTHQKLYRMSVDGKWAQMAGEITDEMLDTFAVCGTYDTIVRNIKSTYGEFATSVNVPCSVGSRDEGERLQEVIRELKCDRPY